MNAALRLALPLILALAGPTLYLSFVRPLVLSNHEREVGLEQSFKDGQRYTETHGVYPTETVLNQTNQRLEKKRLHLRELMSLRSEENIPDRSLTEIFQEWGWDLDSKPSKRIQDFQEMALRAVGQDYRQTVQDYRETVQALTCTLAQSFCTAGLADFEKLTCRAEAEGDHPESAGTGLKILQAEVLFNGGLTDGMRFLEEWVLNNGDGFLIEPVKLLLRRIEPGQWQGNLQEYLGPPVRLEFQVLIYLDIDKG